MDDSWRIVFRICSPIREVPNTKLGDFLFKNSFEFVVFLSIFSYSLAEFDFVEFL